MDTIKPELERVKNLLLDTVTLLCKNSLQYENYLRVEGLLGVAVDGKDTFFLHISERFQSEAYVERLNHEREEKEAEAARKEQREKDAAAQIESEREQASKDASEALAIKVKTESRDQGGEDSDDLVITGSSGLQSPQTVANQASMVAGQRRAPRRPHSPSSNAHNQSDSEYHQTQQNSPYVQSDSGDGEGSFSQYENNQSIKTEEHWGDGPTAAKRQSISNPWPNVTSMGDLSLQAAQASFQDGDGSFGGGGDLSQPGCSAWPTNLPGSQDSTTYVGGDGLNDRVNKTLPAIWMSDPKANKKRIECLTCGLAFENPWKLRRHQVSHSGDKPFHCTHCPSKFSRADHLKRHVTNKHFLPGNGVVDYSGLALLQAQALPDSEVIVDVESTPPYAHDLDNFD